MTRHINHRRFSKQLDLAITESLESRTLLSAAMTAIRPLRVPRSPPPVTAPILGPKQLLPGDSAIGGAPGVQNASRISQGGNQFLAVWADRRTALGFTGVNG